MLCTDIKLFIFISFVGGLYKNTPQQGGLAGVLVSHFAILKCIASLFAEFAKS